MTNDIIDGISIKLNEVFGDDYAIYSENVEQGLEEPCFFIQHITNTDSPFVGNRKNRRVNFDIHYFGKSREDMQAVGDTMLDELEYITLLNGDILRGIDRSYQIIDDVLHFSVTYPVVLIKVVEKDKMESYKLTQRLGD